MGASFAAFTMWLSLFSLFLKSSIVFVALAQTTSHDPRLCGVQSSLPPGQHFTQVRMTVTVPTAPTDRYGVSSPGWWVRIASSASSEVFGPTLAWGLERGHFDVSSVYFRNSDHAWQQSQKLRALPEDILTCTITLDNQGRHALNPRYLTSCDIDGQELTATMPTQDHVYDTLIIDMQNHPAKCQELPASTSLKFDIQAFSSAAPGNETTLAWSNMLFEPDCDSHADVNDHNTIVFHWNPNGPAL